MAAKSAAARSWRDRHVSVLPGDPAFYGGDDYRLDESIGYLLRRLRTALDRAIDAEMAGLGLTSVQWGPLLAIAHGLGDTASALSRLVRIDTGAMTRLLDRLEAKGLVRRVRCAEDARVVRLRLTARGRAVCSDIPYGLARVLNHSLRGFTPDELDVFRSLVRRMLANVGTE